MSKLEHLDDIGIFLEQHNLPKLTEEEIENLNTLVSIKILKLVDINVY